MANRRQRRKIKRLRNLGLPILLHPAEGRELCQQKGEFTGIETEWETLIKYYGGNPLALKMAASGTQALVNSNACR